MGHNDCSLENNYYNTPDEDASAVCIDCLCDADLIGNLKGNVYKAECSFCGKNENVVNTEDLFKEVLDAVLADGWVRAIDEGSYCSAEGGYQHETTELKELALTYCEEANISNEALLTCVYECFSDEWMIDKPYGEDYHDERYTNEWEKFKACVKNKQRYTAFLDNDAPYITEFKNLMQFIDEKYRVILEHSSNIFRGRIFDSDIPPDINVSSYGPPATKFTKNSRMSPQGIVCLYCSSNIRTVISEIITCKTRHIGITKIKPKQDLKLIDLVNIRLPSAFDKQNRRYRRSVDFLELFIEEVSKPINIDDKEHLEYMPTQVIFEYLKHVFGNKGVAGIQFRSSKHPDGINYAIFCDNSGFSEKFEFASAKAKIIHYTKC